MRSKKAIILSWAKKIKAINLLGGKCSVCDENDPVVLEFHHKNDKRFNVAAILSNRWSIIEEEIKNTVLLCRNCHQIANKSDHLLVKYKRSPDRRYEENKKIYLEYVGAKECSECGYTGNNSVLVFHHINQDQKKFTLSNLSKRFYTLEDLQCYVTGELDKCVVLCHNCHQKIHMKNSRYVMYKNEILEESKNIKENQKIDHSEVCRLYDEGKTYNQICRMLNIKNKSNVSNIIRKR